MLAEALLERVRPPLSAHNREEMHPPSAAVGLPSQSVHLRSPHHLRRPPLRKGVPAEMILKESSSFDTLGNAYFCLCDHAVPLRWRRPLVVTSEFHMPRSRAAFEGVFRLARDSGLPVGPPAFLATANTGMDPDVLAVSASLPFLSCSVCVAPARRFDRSRFPPAPPKGGAALPLLIGPPPLVPPSPA